MIRATQFSTMCGPVDDPCIWTYPQYSTYLNRTYYIEPSVCCFMLWAQIFTIFYNPDFIQQAKKKMTNRLFNYGLPQQDWDKTGDVQ